MRPYRFVLHSMITLVFVLATGAQQPATAAPSPAVPPSATTTVQPVLYTWARTWGGVASNAGGGKSVGDAQGNVYVAGSYKGTVDFNPDPVATDIHTSVSNSIDAFLAKYDAQGQFQWAKTWGGTLRDVAYGHDVDSQGNIYVVGPFRNSVDFNPDPNVTEVYTSNAGTENNVFLLKFTPAGSLVWVRTWGPGVYAGGAEGYNVVVDGNYLYIAGDFSGNLVDFNPWGSHDWHQNHLPSSGPVLFDAFLSKFDLNGNFQWARTWGGEGYDDGPGVAVDQTGNVYVAGMYASQTINFDPAGGAGGLGHGAQNSGVIVDVFLSKFDSSGNFQWARTWGSADYEEASGSVAVDAANNVYVAGRFASVNLNFNPDPQGTPDFHSTHNPAAAGNYVLQELTAMDVFLSKFDSSGNFQWAQTWGGNGSDNVSVQIDSANHVYASGFYSDTVDFDPGTGVDTHVSNGQHDLFISQLDTNGAFNWAKTWGGAGDEFGEAGLGPAGQVYFSGYFANSVDFDPGVGTDWHAATGSADAFLSQFVAVPAMEATPLALITLAQAGGPARAWPLQITSSSLLTFTWTASLTPTVPGWISVQPVSGQSGQTLTITITPTVSAGLMQTSLHLVSSDPQVTHADQLIPIQVTVVDQLMSLDLPAIFRHTP